MVWEAVFLLLILKIPIVYLCCVVWWAVRAEPKPYEGALRTVPLDPEPRPGWQPRRPVGPRPRRGGPHGVPRRAYARPSISIARATLSR